MIRTTKTIRIGLLAMLLSFVCLNVFGQTHKASVKVADAPISKVLALIEKQTDYRFSYRNSILGNQPNVTLDMKDATVSQILDRVFAGKDISYNIVSDKSIVLFVKDKTQVEKKSITVKGKVVDSEGEPMIGAGVMLKGSGTGVVTDLDGNYTINAKTGDVLIYQFMGFVNEERTVTGPDLNVVMKADENTLDEVVVLGFGIAQKKQDLSASIGVLKNPEKLVMRSVSNTTGLLQGQISGVTVQENSGDPTAGFNMVIRGQGSPNGDSILWVVDGVPGASIPSPDDIVSIVVLKDAASAAIYGAQSGAGGVVIVTTKQGKTSDGLNVEYDGQVSLSRPTNIIHGLNAEDFVAMRTQSTAAAGLGDFLEGYDQDFKDYISTTRTDWTDAITRTAISHRHTVALTSGSKHVKNRLSATYTDKEGTFINTYSKEFNLNYKGEYNINDYIRITENALWSTGKSHGANTSSETSGVLINAIYAPSFATPYTEDGKYGGWFPEKWESQTGFMGDSYNPVASLTRDQIWNPNQTFQTHTSLQIHDLIKGLQFISRFSYWRTHNYSTTYSGYRYEVTGRQESSSLSGSSLSNSASTYSNWKTENTLTYDRTFGKHTVGAMVSTTSNCTPGGRSMANGATGFETDDNAAYYYIRFATTTNTPTDGWTGSDSNVALISRLSYSYDDRYFLTASWRRDYAGRLFYDYNYGDFPAFTGAWKISSEKFFEPLKNTVNFLKIRGSWGRVGNLGSVSSNYSSNNLTSTNQTKRRAPYGIDNASSYGMMYYPEAKNIQLTWETSRQWDLGIDAAFFKNRLSFSADYYNKLTYNLIHSQTAEWPTTLGFSSTPLVNQGEVANRGIELELGWNDVIGDFSYYARGNFSYNHNEVLSTGTQNEDGSWVTWTGGGSFRNIPYVYSTCVGGPLNQFYLIKCQGIFQSWEDIYDHVSADGQLIQPSAQPGDLKFEDYNGDGKINDDDRQYVGSATPKITYSLSGGLAWKNLSLDLMLQGVAKAQVFYPGQTMIVNDNEGNFNRAEAIKNAWGWYKTTDATIPRLSRSDPNGNFSKPSTYFLEDGSYLRLKSLTLSYDITEALRKHAHFAVRGSSVKVFATGENLFTLTHYTGMDPECGGYDSLKYPVSRTFTFGVKLSY